MSDNRRVKVWKDDHGAWRWTAWKSSDRVATSGEGYANKSHALEMVAGLYPEADGWALEVEGEGE